MREIAAFTQQMYLLRCLSGVDVEYGGKSEQNFKTIFWENAVYTWEKKCVMIIAQLLNNIDNNVTIT